MKLLTHGFLQRALLLALLLTGLRLPEARAAASLERRQQLVVLHTNDVHGQILPTSRWVRGQELPPAGGLMRLAAKVREQRALAQRSGAAVLVLDAGDWFQGTPEGMVEQGSAFVAAMVLVGYDAMALGNHEFDLGLAPLRRLLDASQVPALCANLQQRPGGPPVTWVKPWRIVEAGELSVGIVGLITPSTPSISHRETRELGFEDPLAALQRARAALRGRAEALIAVTHLGVEEDERLAEAMAASRQAGDPPLVLVVGGHSHRFLDAGLVAGESLLVQAGNKAQVLGRASFEFELNPLRVLEARAELLELRAPPTAETCHRAVEQRGRALVAVSERSMAQPLGRLEAPLVRGSGVQSGSAGNFVADQLRALAQADVGLMNRGGIRRDLAAGAITRRELFELVPFANTVVVLQLRGRELEEWLRLSVEGGAHSGLEVSGLRVVVRARGSQAPTFVRAELHGKPLDPDAPYSVATNSFLAGGGDGYARAALETLDTGILVREALERAFLERSSVTPAGENRYLVLDQPAEK